MRWQAPPAINGRLLGVVERFVPPDLERREAVVEAVAMAAKTASMAAAGERREACAVTGVEFEREQRGEPYELGAQGPCQPRGSAEGGGERPDPGGLTTGGDQRRGVRERLALLVDEAASCAACSESGGRRGREGTVMGDDLL